MLYLYLSESSKLQLSEKDYKMIFGFLRALLYKKDGSRTKFAKKYNIKNYSDFYTLFKEIKQHLKNDREGIAFGIMKDMAKVNVGRIWSKMPGNTPEEKVFNAWSVTLDAIATTLDNLKVLKSALKQMEEDEKVLRAKGK